MAESAAELKRTKRNPTASIILTAAINASTGEPEAHSKDDKPVDTRFVVQQTSGQDNPPPPHLASNTINPNGVEITLPPDSVDLGLASGTNSSLASKK